MIAAIAGDQELAKEFASSYRVRPSSQVVRQFEIRNVILRHVLAEDHEGLTALATKLKPGYPADYPPALIELPLGVINRDVEMVCGAVRKLGTAMRNKWDVKKHRAWYDKRVAKYGTTGWRSPGTWEQCLANTKGALVGGHWVLSWWALAWLNIARWHGMSKVFDDGKIFSEWIPAELT
jgi:hypothetical protein